MIEEKREKVATEVESADKTKNSGSWIVWILGILVLAVIIVLVIKISTGSGYTDSENYQLESKRSGEEVQVEVTVDNDN